VPGANHPQHPPVSIKSRTHATTLQIQNALQPRIITTPTRAVWTHPSTIIYLDTPSSKNTSMSDLPHRPNPDFLAYLTDIAALPFRPSQSQANGRRRKSNVNFFPSSYLRCRMSHTTILHSAVGGVIARNRLTAHSSSQPRQPAEVLHRESFRQRI